LIDNVGAEARATLPATPQGVRGDLFILIALAVARLIFHFFTNHQYGFHRDELATLDDAHHLAWGYVAYPPLVPLVMRGALELFGPSLVGVRFFSGLTQAAAVVLTGLMVREMGGSRWAQTVAAMAVVVAPISMLMGALFQYVAFDYVWWVLTAYLLVRLLKREDARLWVVGGAVLGLGMMTKYTIGVFIIGVVMGILLTDTRRYLRSGWLWVGVAVSILIFLPNLIWQMQNNFISLEFLAAIRMRDVQIGRTAGFLPEQLVVNASPLTIPLWLAGLGFYFFAPVGGRFRLIGWLYVVPLILFVLLQGRSYYLGPAYPMLFAGGAIWWESWLATRSSGVRAWGRGLIWAALAMSLPMAIVLMTPIAPVNSPLWEMSNAVHDNFREEIGWQELTATVAEIYHALPATEQAQTAILTGNYGEAGAINLYGPQLGLPRAISGMNSLWFRGYGSVPPSQVIVLGFTRERAEMYFAACELVGQVSNRYGVENEESAQPEIWLCKEPRAPWDELWPQLQRFG
jgi:4-amino-4-deoxy-L-arabinose transferase-like glycosyltransferase